MIGKVPQITSNSIAVQINNYESTGEQWISFSNGQLCG